MGGIVISQDLADALDNMSPAAQNAQLGEKLKSALEADFPDQSIQTAELANLVVTTAKLADLNVTGAKIANATIETGKLKPDSDNIFQLASGLKLSPTIRPVANYAYFLQLDCDEFMTGDAAKKTYMLGISGERPDTAPATGDSNDAIIKASYSNYAANDANFIMRGLNSAITNRELGTLGVLEGASIGAQNKGTGVAPTIRGLTIRSENYGTNATEFGVLDVNCSDEVGAATLRYGARIRNTDASVVAALSHGLLFSSTATNGFNNVITVQNAAAVFANFDDVTGEACTEDGAESTTWAGRIKVITPDGNAAYINLYSTRN